MNKIERFFFDTLETRKELRSLPQNPAAKKSQTDTSQQHDLVSQLASIKNKLLSFFLGTDDLEEDDSCHQGSPTSLECPPSRSLSLEKNNRSLLSTSQKSERNGICIEKSERQIAIDIFPTAWKNQNFLKRAALGLLCSFFGYLFFMVALLGLREGQISIFAVAYLLGGGMFAWSGIITFARAIRASFCRTQIAIDSKSYRICWSLQNCFHNKITGRTEDILEVALSNRSLIDGFPLNECAIVDVDGQRTFGFTIAQKDREWIIAEISDFLTAIRSQNVSRETR